MSPKEAAQHVGKRIIHRVERRIGFTNGRWHYDGEDRNVKLLAVAGIWAMIRRPGAAPYIADVKELREIPVAPEKESEVE